MNTKYLVVSDKKPNDCDEPVWTSPYLGRNQTALVVYRVSHHVTRDAAVRAVFSRLDAGLGTLRVIEFDGPPEAETAKVVFEAAAGEGW